MDKNGKVVIDVREPFEFEIGHVAGAINIPPSQIMQGEETFKGIPKDAEIIVYCRTGSRSAVAMNIMQRMGFKNVVNGINKDQVQARFL